MKFYHGTSKENWNKITFNLKDKPNSLHLILAEKTTFQRNLEQINQNIKKLLKNIQESGLNLNVDIF